MGRPKHLLEMGGKTWLEHLVRTVEPFVEQTVLLGAGQVPAPLAKLTVVPDAPGVEGPLAGMLAALRWQPFASWLFAACDLPLMSAEAVQWLLATRRPGVWATVPRLDGRTGVEPLLAHYDFRCRHLLEQCTCPSEVIRWDRVATPVVPRELAASWRNINTAAELRALVRLRAR
jgi:molybdopterin-guanine dinucleotide biosynthesis protein A